MQKNLAVKTEISLEGNEMNRIDFDDFQIDLDLYRLSRRGESRQIGAKPLDVLVYLIQHRDHVVDRNSLRRDIWRSAQLSDAAIPTCIMEIRRALDDDAARPKYIESTRGRGYRFIASARCSGPKTRLSSTYSAELEFVGRTDEMNVLAGAAQSIRSHAPGKVFLISGEAGIGKTRLLAEFNRSVDGHINTIGSKAPAFSGTPPFWPWIQLLNAAIEQRQPADWELIEEARPLAEIFSEVRISQTPQKRVMRLSDRFSIFSQWSRAIRSIAANRATVLSLEDIHRSDPDSQSLLYWVCEELSNEPILFIATYRPYPINDQLAEILTDVGNLPQTTSLTLGPLDAKDISKLVDPSLGAREDLGRYLSKSTNGNAFYVTQLIRSLEQNSNTASAVPLASTLPLNGREIVSRQLADLSKSVRSLLSAASTLGDKFSLDVLSQMLDVPPLDIAAQLDSAERALIVRREGSSYRFRHTLLRDALYQLLSPRTLRRLHLAAATALRQGLDRRSRSAEISDHLTAALPLGSHSVAKDYAVRAGREAAARFAFARARSYFERALEILDTTPGAAETARFDVLVELSGAALYETDRVAARKMLLEAASIAREADSVEKLARCALEMSPNFLSIEVGTFDQTLVSLLEEAISKLGDSNLSLRARCLARLSQAKYWRKSSDQDEGLALQAIDLAIASGDDRAIVAAYAARAEAMNGPQFARERVAILRNVESMLSRVNDTPAHLVQKTRLISAHLELGEIRNVEEINDQYRSLADTTGLAQYRWMPVAHDCMLATMRGELERANALALEYRKIAGENPDANVVQTFALQFAFLEVEHDRTSKILPLALEMAKNQRAVLGWKAAVAFLQWDAGNTEEARASLNEFSESDIARALTDVGGGLSIAILSEVAVRLGEKKYVSILRTHLARLIDKYACAGYGMLYLGSFARYAGLVAHSIGDSQAAIAYLNTAIECEEKRRAYSCGAIARLDLIEIQIACDLSPDRAIHQLEDIYREASSRKHERVRRRAREALSSVESLLARTSSTSHSQQ